MPAGLYKLVVRQELQSSHDEKLAERVWFRLLRLHIRFSGAMAKRLRGIGLTVAQFDVLTTLTERQGISQQELALRLYVTKGNISGLIDRLAKSGLVERRSTETDRRSHSIYLTPEGCRLVRQGLDLQRDFVSKTFGRLSPAQSADFEALIIAVRDHAHDAGELSSRKKRRGEDASSSNL